MLYNDTEAWWPNQVLGSLSHPPGKSNKTTSPIYGLSLELFNLGLYWQNGAKLKQDMQNG